MDYDKMRDIVWMAAMEKYKQLDDMIAQLDEIEDALGYGEDVINMRVVIRERRAALDRVMREASE